MQLGFPNAPAPARLGTASTYDGFYLRPNLKSEGTVPSYGPYDLCPDIIQSSEAIADPQDTLSTLKSWQTLYNTAPSLGENYYYVRGINGATESFSGKMSLYWAPAQLILFPSTWKNNPLSTANDKEWVSVSADSGHIGVGSDAFILQYPGASGLSADSFYAFVAQNTTTLIPEISSWMDMSVLITQQLSFGFRNMVNFDPAAGEMLYRLGINIPASVGQSGTLLLTLTATGFANGDTVGFIGDCFTPEMKEIVLKPITINSDPYTTGIQVSLDPGFTSSLAVQYWNTGTPVPAAGSSITLLVEYLVPDDQIEQALQMNILDSRYSLRSAKRAKKAGLSVGPTQVAPLGAISFVVAESSGS